MELGLIIGIVAGFACTILSILIAGGMQVSALLSFIDAPSILITIGGAVCAVIASTPIAMLKNALTSVKKILKPDACNPIVSIKDIGELANVARREGLLALDDKSSEMDTFLRKGIMLVVDGTEQELVRDILETEISFIKDRHKENIEVWELFASQFPAWGMIGTLIGLVIMLQNLDDPSTIGPKMAVAIITTFYGSLLANWLATPIATKMKIYSKQEMLVKEIMIEGVLSIAAGENPRVIEEKLKVFIAPNVRTEFDEKEA